MTAWWKKLLRPAAVQAVGERSVAIYGDSHSPVVTGDNVTLTFHPPGPDLEQRWLEWDDLVGRVRTPRSPSSLLEAHRAVVPFRGRADVLEELAAWCAEPGFGVHLVYGPGGQGKTRLARRFTDELQEDWNVLWLAPHASVADLSALSSPPGPVVVVVDYAEARADQLLALLRAALRSPDATPFKVLLLARTAHDWWPEFQDRARIEDLYAVEGTLLPPLEPHAADRVDAYRQAVEALADALPRVPGQEGSGWPARAARVLALPAHRLQRPGLECALTLHMTALADLLDAAGEDVEEGDGRPPPSPAPTGSAEERLLSHERVYWRAVGEASGVRQTKKVEAALAAAFLCGAHDQQEAQALLARVPGLEQHSPDTLGDLSKWIAQLYPPPDRTQVWGSLHPDRLAEFFVGGCLGSGPELSERLLDGAGVAQATRLLTVSTRAAGHPAHRDSLDADLTQLCVRHADTLATAVIDVAVHVERPDPLLAALEQLADASDPDPAPLLRLAGHLPRPTHRLADFALHLARRLVQLHRDRAAQDPALLPDLAGQLRLLCCRLGDAGLWAEAYQTALESLRLLTPLARQDPRTYEVQLAACLLNISVALGASGRREASVFPAHQAVRLYRRIGWWDGGASLPELAHALNAVSQAEGELGRLPTALTASREAIAVRRQLLDQHGDASRPDLAAALNNHAVRLQQAGRGHEALGTAREATDHYRALAQDRPDAHRAGLGMSLGTLSSCLRDAGRHTAALRCAEESADIRRELARERPAAFQPALARSLNALAIDLGRMGHQDRAVAKAKEAVDLYRALAQRDRTAYAEPLAMSLNTLACQLEKAGQAPQALTAAQEAVELYRSIAARNPSAHRADLAMALNTLADELAQTGHGDEALKAAREAVSLYRTLADQQPRPHLDALSTALNTFGLHLKALGHLADALDAFDEAIGISRRITATPPADAALTTLATALANKAVCLSDLHRPQDALHTVEESVHVYQELMRKEPEACQPQLVTALSIRHLLLVVLGRTDEVPDAVEKTLRVRATLVRQDRAAHLTHYGDELTLLGVTLALRGRYGEAAGPLDRAVAVHRELTAEDTRHRPVLAQGLLALAYALNEAGRHGESLPVAEEAVMIWGDSPPADATHRSLLVWALCALGTQQHLHGRPEAEAILRRAADMAADLPDDIPGPPRQRLQSAALAALGTHLAQTARPELGLPLLAQAADLPPGTDEDAQSARAGLLIVYGHHLATDAADHETALALTLDAVRLYEELAAHNSAVHEREVAWGLAHLGLRLTESGRYEDAAQATDRAVALSRRLGTSAPASHRLLLAVSLYAQARADWQAGTAETRAQEHITEALTILRALAEQTPGMVTAYLEDAERTYDGMHAPHRRRMPRRDRSRPPAAGRRWPRER
ncbi:Tetratricopeptide repeat-containing protein [Streptomyces sp. 2112.3]|uniref:tetratricopeptide repeat protein n=1 Tax=Streptomyces sp. 2112.3 TaxID=1881023 RepID=UPI00089B8E0F|nr:tetratricopeptide repeat protein [Streptomyces sp. 2112.3]SEF14186.1 Tetratricopeptide repeat-containing protein [Streptomyces sp. 2112.3]